MTDREIEALLTLIGERTGALKTDLQSLREWVGEHEKRVRTLEDVASEQRGRESSERSVWSNGLQILGILAGLIIGILALIFH